MNGDPTSISGNSSEYDYPSSGKDYGQSFLCISVDSDQFDLIGEQLIYNQVTVFKRNILGEYDRSFPTLAGAARQKRIKHPPFSNKALLRSSDSMQFWSFAKSDKWQKGNFLFNISKMKNVDMFFLFIHFYHISFNSCLIIFL